MAWGQGTNVLVDANALYSRTLRDWLALLYLRSGQTMFEVLWTDDIMVEFQYHLRKKHPFLDDAQCGGVRRNLEETFASGHIRDFTIDPDGHYPDIGDAHVHCAAIQANADILLTADTKGFPESDNLPYEIYTCDDFFLLIDDSAPQVVRTVIEEQLRYHHTRGTGISLPERLKVACAPNFAERVRRHLQHIDVGRILGASTSEV